MGTYYGTMTYTGTPKDPGEVKPRIDVTVSSPSAGRVRATITLKFYTAYYCSFGINYNSSLTFSCGGKSVSESTQCVKAMSGTGWRNVSTANFTMEVSGVSGGTQSWSLTWKRWNMSVSYRNATYTSLTCTASGSTSVVASYTACTAPKLTVNKTSAYMGDSMTVSYSGAAGGTNNGITGYDVQWSHNKSTWNTYNVSLGTSTKGSFSHSEVSTTGWMYFRMRTKGSAGSSYYSGWSNVVGCNYTNIGNVTGIQYVRSAEEPGAKTGAFDYWCDRKAGVKWNAVAGATTYQVKIMYVNNSHNYADFQTVSTSSTSYTFILPARSIFPGNRYWDATTEPKTGTRFYINVRAGRNGFYSDWIGNGYACWRSATVRIRDSSSWKNGAVYIYTSSGWRVAREVYVYNGSKWIDSKRF